MKIIANIGNKLNTPNVVNDINKTIRNLNDELFKLVVLGEFSRGKSTVVNAFLGDRVLPASSQPTTTVLSRITYSEIPTFQLIYRDKTPTKKISQEDFIKLVAPSEPIPGDEESERIYQRGLEEYRKVEYAKIGYPSPLCENSVEIVDTPGTNDLDPVREKITYDFIPASDAVIIVLSAKMILAKTEMDFLRDRILKADIQRIFFVINFSDHLKTEEDRKKILDYARKHLRLVVGEPRLYLVSAKAAMGHRRLARGGPDSGSKLMPFSQTGFIELEQDLSTFLTNERGKVKLAKPIDHGIRLCNELEKGPIALIKASIGVELADIQEKIKKFQPKIQKLELERDKIIKGLQVAMINHGVDLVQELRRGMERIAELAVYSVDNYLGELNKEDISHAIECTVAPMQTDLQVRMRERQEDIIKEECGRAQRRIEDAWEELYLSMDKIFNTGARNIGNIETIETIQEDDIVVKSGFSAAGVGLLMLALHFSIPIVILTTLFTGGWLYNMFKKQARERILGKVRVQVDSRFRDIIPETLSQFELGWQRLVKKLSGLLVEEVDRNLTGLKRQLTNLLEEHKSAKANADEKRAFISSIEMELTRARGYLLEVKM